jgi:hypothetical protein
MELVLEVDFRLAVDAVLMGGLAGGSR